MLARTSSYTLAACRHADGTEIRAGLSTDFLEKAGSNKSGVDMSNIDAELEVILDIVLIDGCAINILWKSFSIFYTFC